MSWFINDGSFIKKYSYIECKRKATFRCLLMGISKHKALKRLNNSVTYDRGVNMNFSPNKTPIEIIKEGAFGGTYFRDIYFGINEK